jgi:hypothetical protein
MAATQAGAQLYTQDFETNPGYNTTGSAIGFTGSALTYFTFGEYTGASGRDFPVSQAAGVFHIVSGDRSNRNRSMAVYIDTSAAVAGNYTVSFEVSNWVAGSGTTPGTSGFKVWEGRGLDTGWIDVDFGDNATSGATPRALNTTTATWGNTIGSTWGTGTAATGITGNGTISFDFTLTEAGQAGDYMALGWVSQNLDLASPNYDIDNVLVEELGDVNLPPVADDDSVDVVQNKFVDITLTGSDPEGSNLTYNVNMPTNGSLLLVTNQTYTYTPDTDYTGPDSFTFTVNDGDTNSEPATVSILVWEQPVVGTILYEEDFTTDPGYNTVSEAIGAAGSVETYFTFEEYAGNGEIGVTTTDGVLHIDSSTSLNRNRSLTVFIDTSAASPGTYTVSFDVSNWTAGTGTTPGFSGFKAVEGSGLDTGWLDMDYGDNATSGGTPRIQNTTTAVWGDELGNTWGDGAQGSGISSNGTVSFDIDLTEAGQPGDYLALGWVQQMMDSTAPTFDVDNVVVGVGTGGGGPQTDPVITDFSVSGSDVTLTWTAGNNGTYSIQRKTSLLDVIWTDVLTGLLGGGGTATVQAGGTNEEFYQIYGE